MKVGSACPNCDFGVMIHASKLGHLKCSYSCGVIVPNEDIKLPEEKDDPVNHPSHYCSHPSGIACITITRHHDFAVGNAMKYMWRAGLKDSSPEKEVEDLRKAIWYLNDKIEQLLKGSNGRIQSNQT